MNTYMSLQMCLKYIPKMTFQQQKITKGVNIVWFSGEYYVEFDSKHNFELVNFYQNLLQFLNFLFMADN